MSAAWAAGTPRIAPPAGLCPSCLLSSSECTRMPALEWPVCTRGETEQERCYQIYSRGWRGEHQTVTPALLRDVTCANIQLCCSDKFTVWYQMPQLPWEGSTELNQRVFNKERANIHTLAPALKPPEITPWTNIPDRRGDGRTSPALVKMHERSVTIWSVVCAKTVCPCSPWSG